MNHIVEEILQIVDKGCCKKAELTKLLAHKHDVSVQNIYQHLKQLESTMQVFECSKGYLHLSQNRIMAKNFNVDQIDEFDIFQEHIFPHIKKYQQVEEIISYVFTEMLNNVMDHSEGQDVHIALFESPYGFLVSIYDDGIGIFKKICTAKKLKDEQHAMLELSKGRLTTMPEAHSGEGIFFSSKVCDEFSIMSHGLIFHHKMDISELSDLEGLAKHSLSNGTRVVFKVNKFTAKTIVDTFNQYTTTDNDGVPVFSKTIIKAKLLQYENESLVSRSQAKRLLTRLNEFKEAVIDFEGIKIVGQGFADEIFRVFSIRHPDIKISYINAASDVEFMIKHAMGSNKKPH